MARSVLDIRELETLFELSLDLLCVASLDGYFLRVSPAFERTLGWSEEELLALPFLELVHPDDRGPTLEAMDNLREGEKVRSFQNRYRCRDRSWKWLSWQAVSLPEKRRIYAIARDVTDEKVRSQAIVDARDEAVAASRLKARFMATISHELRTPLNSIIGFSELLRTQLEGEVEPKRLRHLERIHRAGNRLHRLVSDILDLSSLEAGRLAVQLRPTSVAETIRVAVRGAREAIAIRHHHLEIDEISEEVEVIADPGRSRQILDNLLSNAIKFTPDGGHLAIRIDAGPTEVTIAIRDDGIGIAKADQGRIFEPFHQVDSSLTRTASGTGLGLALSRRLAELMHGRLELQSHPESGSIFSLVLPRSG